MEREIPPACTTTSLGPQVPSHLRFMAYPRSTPLKPIVSCIKSPLTTWPNTESVISALAGQTDSNVSNSKHFVEMMEDVLVDEEETMVSFYVSSVFTDVPIGEAVDIIGRMLV